MTQIVAIGSSPDRCEAPSVLDSEGDNAEIQVIPRVDRDDESSFGIAIDELLHQARRPC